MYQFWLFTMGVSSVTLWTNSVPNYFNLEYNILTIILIIFLSVTSDIQDKINEKLVKISQIQ